MVEFLIKNKADVNAKGSDNSTALMQAAVEGDFQIKTSKVYQITCFLIYWKNIYSDNEEIAKILIDNGADIDSKDDEDYTALHFATLKGNIQNW